MPVTEWRPTVGCATCLSILRYIAGWGNLELKRQVDIVVAQGMPASQADIVCPECYRVFSPARVIADRNYMDPAHSSMSSGARKKRGRALPRIRNAFHKRAKRK